MPSLVKGITVHTLDGMTKKCAFSWGQRDSPGFKVLALCATDPGSVPSTTIWSPEPHQEGPGAQRGVAPPSHTQPLQKY